MGSRDLVINKIKGGINFFFSPYPGASLSCEGEIGLPHSVPVLCSEPFPGQASWLLIRRFCWETETSNLLFLVCPTTPSWLCLGSSAKEPQVRKLFSVCGKKNMDFLLTTKTFQSCFFFCWRDNPKLVLWMIKKMHHSLDTSRAAPKISSSHKRIFFLIFLGITTWFKKICTQWQLIH